MTEEELEAHVSEYTSYDLVYSFTVSISEDCDNYNSEIEGELHLGDDMDGSHKIGCVRAHHIDLNGAEVAGFDAVALFDAHAVTEHLCHVVFDAEGRFDRNLERLVGDIFGVNILLIYSVEVLPDFDTDGLKIVAVYRTIQRLSGGCGLVFLDTDSLWGADAGAARPGSDPGGVLIKMGFREVGDEGLMVLNPAVQLPKFEEVVRATIALRDIHHAIN